MTSRILLADDHEIVRSGMKSLLDAHHPWVVCGEAENGKQAVEKVMELKPDMVVLDLSMPVMNGIEAAREIRKLSPKTKIVMFSMHDSARMAYEAKEAGADAYIVKSSGIDVIEKTLDELVGNRRASQ